MKNKWSWIVAVLLMLFARSALAVDVTVEWTWPTTYCSGETLDVADIQGAEVFISETSIPRVPSDCADGEQDVPPASAIVATTTTGDPPTVVVDLECGKTYFLVVRTMVGGAWSNFSNEAVKDLSCGRPRIPVIIRVV